MIPSRRASPRRSSLQLAGLLTFGFRARLGRDVILFASGPIASNCLAAADRLATEDLTIGVLTVPCIKPFDHALAREVTKGARLLLPLRYICFVAVCMQGC